MDKKGFCLDDETFSKCPESMIGVWPHTQEVVKSLRLFKAWNDDWGDKTVRDKAWNNLRDYIKTNNAKVFIGTGVGCEPEYDEEDWATVKELMKLLGPEHVMGVGIGNEMDILWTWPGVTQQCLDDLWGGRYFKLLQSRVADMDSMGFQDTPVTVVWGMSVLGGQPFKDDSQAKVGTLLKQAYAKWQRRWIWTFNIYAIWDNNLRLDPGSPDKCYKAIAEATGPYTKDMVASVRKRMKMVTGNSDDPLWIGETGWSSPKPDGSNLIQSKCPDYCSKDTFKKIYSAFVGWDFSLEAKDQEFAGPDHAFYFAMRDSHNMGMGEYFGMVESCTATTCKINGAKSDAPVVSNTTVI